MLVLIRICAGESLISSITVCLQVTLSATLDAFGPRNQDGVNYKIRCKVGTEVHSA